MDSHAERTEFIQKHNLYKKPVPMEDHLFDHEFGWKLCLMPPEEFAMQIKKAEAIRDKYSLSEYLRNPTEKHEALLEANRVEIEKAFDIFAVSQTFNQGYKEGCEYLKSEGFFGLEHKKE